MEREKIIFFRNFFFAAFIIGLIFALFYFGATVLFWNTGTSWATHFFKIDEKEFGENDSDVELHHALTRAREIALKRSSLRLHWQCARPRGRQHVVSRLPRITRRARLVRAWEMES